MYEKKRGYTIDDYEELGNGHCGIYVITDILNGKKYVGQSVDILRRWNQHITSRDKTALYEAMKIDGQRNFIFQIIEECRPEELNTREYFWIEKLNTYEEGYNTTRGNVTYVELSEPYDNPDSDLIILSLQKDARHPGEDYDCIHGTDNPFEIDLLIKDILYN